MTPFHVISKVILGMYELDLGDHIVLNKCFALIVSSAAKLSKVATVIARVLKDRNDALEDLWTCDEGLNAISDSSICALQCINALSKKNLPSALRTHYWN
ncbi:hypothetical protein O0I10_012494 [Lichtheimia ornata]|uniref:Uncharacterized protein n=1 Tax=Lichtheimia ornata TaxID=688661 RepID=A0AAD7XT13_9FUNG|nr:uncharacterized protein O0I10_012494 [Lichtheimia ornata]KAJ8651923.1 hypothetical protein O0I10_012494 [Lichtheimia ornata]